VKAIRYLLYLIITTAIVTQVSFALYTSSYADSASVRVAKFNVQVTQATPWSGGAYFDGAYNTAGNNKDYTFTLTNYSEVAVLAKLVIDSYDYPITNTPQINDWLNGTTLATGESKAVTLSVSSGVNNLAEVIDGNNVRIHFEYEQID